MCLVPTCVAMVIGYDWYPRVWLWQLGVVGCRVYGGGSWKWLAPTCMSVAVACDWVPKCVDMAIVCDW